MHPVPQMANRLKLKLSRVIPSLQFCRHKHPSTFLEDPIIAKYKLSPVNPKTREIAYPNLPTPPPSTPDDSFIDRRVSNKIASVGCGCGLSPCIGHSLSEDCSSDTIEPHHVMNYDPKTGRKIYGERSFPREENSNTSLISVTRKKCKKKESENGWFSSEEEETDETESLQSSSMTTSNNSSYDFNQASESTIEKSDNDSGPVNSKKANVKKNRKLKRHVSFCKTKILKNESHVKVMRQRRTIPCMADGKMKESVAVAKKSMDPYDDFKMSMLEMILEKQMFEANDLEQLLQCFLCLNSRQYHVLIVEAFTEIWKVLFCDDKILL